jgi:carbohydrate-selective porin OprB
MNNADAENIKKSMTNQPRIIEKYHASLAYLMELGYDLAIQPSVNVLNNPGFESFVGVF